MQRYKIIHRTYYNFPSPVWLNPHELRLRPKEGHELRIESSKLEITPAAVVEKTGLTKVPIQILP